MTDDIMHKLSGEVKRKRFSVVDIETKDGNTQKGGFTRPFLTGYYDGLQFISFKGSDCIERTLAFLLAPHLDGMTYYAHNGGGFDWLHFLPALRLGGYSFEILTVQSKIQMLKVKVSEGSHRRGWTFLDSYQLIPASLGKITKTFQTEIKKQDNFDYDTDEDDIRWLEYLKDDCISLYQTINKFHDLIENNIGGEVGITTASTAMRTYRRTYQPIPIERHSKHHDFFTSCYYGGRVEIFREKANEVNVYDINSSYPFSMLGDMPVGKLIEWEGEPPKWLTEEYIGFVNAKVNIPTDNFIPVLPYRYNNRLIFPVGVFSGNWVYDEIKEAQEFNSAKVEFKKSYWIKKGNLFDSFINKLYEFRDSSSESYDESLSYVAKIMMNSLYGKFGTNKIRDKILVINPETDEIPDGAIPALPDDPECPIYTIGEEIDAPYIIPQIAAYITAKSRLLLYRYINLADLNGEVFYCDTDSIFTNTNLDYYISKELGGIKKEMSAVCGEFIQSKFYCLFDEEGKAKISMKGYQKQTYAEYEKVKLGEVVSYQTLEKIGAMKKKGFLSGPQMTTIIRSIRTDDIKRKHINGITYPLVINEDEIDEEHYF